MAVCIQELRRNRRHPEAVYKQREAEFMADYQILQSRGSITDGRGRDEYQKLARALARDTDLDKYYKEGLKNLFFKRILEL